MVLLSGICLRACPPQTNRYKSDGTTRPYGICNRIKAEKEMFEELFEDSYTGFQVYSLRLPSSLEVTADESLQV